MSSISTEENGESQGVRRCIYCDKTKPSSDFSLEHIFPDRLGGKLCGDLFKTRDVCGRCNSTVGIFVDGAFIKNWFRINDEVMAARQYLDLDAGNSILPLVYQGPLHSLPLPPDQVCEMWLGACGERFYHVHLRDDSRWDTFAGGNPIERHNDPGRVYAILTSTDIRWIRLALRSMKAHFSQARRYAVNFDIRGDDPNDAMLHPIEGDAQRELELIRGLGDAEHHIRIAINPGFEQRFLAKLALGLGYKVLGSNFLETEYARYLHSALWERDRAARQRIPIRGTGYLETEVNLAAQVVAWPGAYTIHLHALQEWFSLSVYLPSGHPMHVCVSDAPQLWQQPAMGSYREGIVFLVIPQLGRFVGPVPFPEYLSHRLGNTSVPVLTELEARRIDPASLPSCGTHKQPVSG